MWLRNKLFAAYIFTSIFLTLSFSLGAAYAVTLDEEIKLGNDIDGQILKQIPQSNDKAANDEIDRLGQQIVKGVRRPQIKYHFRILDEGDELDAFSIPGGYVYFSQRMWDTLKNDERTGVLGHEIAHVDRRHALDAMLKAQRRSIFAAVLLTAIGANRTIANITDMANSLYTLKYSRGDEQQADEVSVDLCQQAGYNPAGILLAMRKIQRFQDEQGGQPPRILSTHPPTKDRIRHLQTLLTTKSIAIPPEVVGDVKESYPVGNVQSASDDTISFNSQTRLNKGDVVWVMGQGWDYHYENRELIPVARGVITTSSSYQYTATIKKLPAAKPVEIKAGMEIDMPPAPKQNVESIGSTVAPSYSSNTIGQLSTPAPLKPFERLLASQLVWDQKDSTFKYDCVGYLVVTNPYNQTGYVSASRALYSYAPVAWGSKLVIVEDEDSNRWVGPVVSIGRSGGTVEVLPNRQMDDKKVYDIAYPAWNKNDSYKKRLIGKAKLISISKKIVLKITDYNPGWGITDVQNGFDIYEQPQEKSEKQ